jgi:hypothetical protein
MASGAFFPGVVPWVFFDGNYTTSSDQEKITASNSEIRSGWINSGNLAEVLWTLDSGTITGVYMRSSTSLPNTRNDDSPIQPASGTILKQYNPSLLTLPTSQGWTKSGTFTTEDASAGQLRTVHSLAAVYGFNSLAGLQTASDHHVCVFEYTPNAGHTGKDGVWWALPHSSVGNRVAVLFGGSSFAWGVFKIDNTTIPGLTITAGTKYHVRVEVRASGTTILEARLFMRVAGSYDITNLEGYIDYGPLARTNLTNSNYFYIGQLDSNLQGDSTWGKVLLYSGSSEWSAISNGQTSFGSHLQRGYSQIKGVLNGTLSELDIKNDLTPPNNPTDPLIKNIGDDGVSIYIPSPVTGASAYEYKLKTLGGTVVDSQIVWNRGWTFTDVADGTYLGEIYSCTDDGVRSVSSATTEQIQVPALVAPAVYIFAASNLIDYGSSTVLTWSVTGSSLTDVTVSGSNGSISGYVGVTSGTITVAPTGMTWYELSATNSAGTAFDSVGVGVKPRFVASVSDGEVAENEVSNLNWATSGGLTFVLNGSSMASSGVTGIVTGSVDPTATVNLDVDDSSLIAGEDATLSYIISGNVNVTLNNAAITGTGEEVVVTAETSSVTPPNKPTLVDRVDPPNRPVYISVLS